MDTIDFLTYGDVVDTGACLDGVLAACKRKNIWFGQVDDLLQVFTGDNAAYILKASGRNGDGDGYGSGDGYGYGSGDGDGYGDGYGDGDGSGSGDGYGDGYGYGSGDGYGSGSGDGYGSGSGYGYGYGYGSGGIE